MLEDLLTLRLRDALALGSLIVFQLMILTWALA